MNRSFLATLVLSPALLLGCGHSEQEWADQLQKYTQVVADRDAKDKELAAARAHLADVAKPAAAAQTAGRRNGAAVTSGA